MNTRRDFLRIVAGSLAGVAAGCRVVGSTERERPLNILLFTADDLHCESVGCFNGKPEGLTPNLDAFAEEGVRFLRAHVSVAICMPSRIVLATGLHCHNSGAMGFMNAKPGTPNVIDIFREAGYLTGVLGKVGHSTPLAGQEWDYAFDQKQLGSGRDPGIYAQRCTDFFDRSKAEGKPFYFMVNSHDPHRPFHDPDHPMKNAAEPSRLYSTEEVPVPGFLPDLPDVRDELSHYLNSTRRLDDTFGAVMEALDKSGFADDTLVMFLSDNGIAMPFAKCNCYLASTLTPWIVRWPGVTKGGRADRTHFISGVDYLPTICAATGVAGPEKMDGDSFIPLLRGESQEGRDAVFTQIDSKAGDGAVPMRCVQNERYGYIFNAWADGKTWYRNNNEGRTMKAMEKAAADDPAIAERVRVFRYRALEELYDLKNDPDCLRNLIDDPQWRQERDAAVERLRDWMVRTGDPLLDAFDKRGDPAALKSAAERVYGSLGENKSRNRVSSKKGKSR